MPNGNSGKVSSLCLDRQQKYYASVRETEKYKKANQERSRQYRMQKREEKANTSKEMTLLADEVVDEDFDIDIFNEDLPDRTTSPIFDSVFDPEWKRSKLPEQIVLDSILTAFLSWVGDHPSEIDVWAHRIREDFKKARESPSNVRMGRWKVDVERRIQGGCGLLCRLKSLFRGPSVPGALTLPLIWSQAFELITEIQSIVSFLRTLVIYLEGDAAM